MWTDPYFDTGPDLEGDDEVERGGWVENHVRTERDDLLDDEDADS